jgi:hypothetical protein
MTYDVQGLPGETLVILLPRAFDRFVQADLRLRA